MADSNLDRVLFSTMARHLGFVKGSGAFQVIIGLQQQKISCTIPKPEVVLLPQQSSWL
jgi:hypothetical protein